MVSYKSSMNMQMQQQQKKSYTAYIRKSILFEVEMFMGLFFFFVFLKTHHVQYAPILIQCGLFCPASFMYDHLHDFQVPQKTPVPMLTYCIRVDSFGFPMGHCHLFSKPDKVCSVWTRNCSYVYSYSIYCVTFHCILQNTPCLLCSTNIFTWFSYHYYADDTQLLLSFPPQTLILLHGSQDVCQTSHQQMEGHQIKPKPNKTEQ